MHSGIAKPLRGTGFRVAGAISTSLSVATTGCIATPSLTQARCITTSVGASVGATGRQEPTVVSWNDTAPPIRLTVGAAFSTNSAGPVVGPSYTLALGRAATTAYPGPARRWSPFASSVHTTQLLTAAVGTGSASVTAGIHLDAGATPPRGVTTAGAIAGPTLGWRSLTGACTTFEVQGGTVQTTRATQTTRGHRLPRLASVVVVTAPRTALGSAAGPRTGNSAARDSIARGSTTPSSDPARATASPATTTTTLSRARATAFRLSGASNDQEYGENCERSRHAPRVARQAGTGAPKSPGPAPGPSLCHLIPRSFLPDLSAFE